MSKTIESNMNEMINSAGDGSGLQLPPAFVMVNPRQHRKYRKIMRQWMVVPKVQKISSPAYNAEK